MWKAALASFALCLSAAPAIAQSNDLLRSDLPLWGDYGDQDVWPHSFAAEADFGCLSLLSGRYRLVLFSFDDEGRRPDDDEVAWVEFQNRSIFHCVMGFADAEGPTGPTFDSRPAFLIDLQPDRPDNNLFALQVGLRGGSEYWLLRRRLGEAGGSFDLLGPECPERLERRAHLATVFRTDYCAAAVKSDVVDMAKAAALRPAIGELTYSGPEALRDGGAETSRVLQSERDAGADAP